MSADAGAPDGANPAAHGSAPATSAAGSRGHYDRAEVEALASRLCRWGRWGADDQLGALNFIDAEAICSAASLVRSGEAISLALPLDSTGPQSGRARFPGRPPRTNPIHWMTQDGGDVAVGAMDYMPGIRFTDGAVQMPLQAATHWDAFSHVATDAGEMYNGNRVELVTSTGAAALGAETMRDRMVGRGVLLDLARWAGEAALPPGYAIGARELEACIASQAVEVRRGDILLVRTGQLAAARAAGWGDYAGGDAPGLALDSAELLHDLEVAAVASDTWGVEVRPNETDEVFQPLHLVLLLNAGVPLGEMFELEALTAACAADGRWDFLFVGPPLPFTGAVGSPANPVAIR
jgi:kynurenine formamidase